jgi:cytochrome P450
VTLTSTISAGEAAVTPDEILGQLFAGDGRHGDPYPLYRRLREAAPVHRSGRDGVWYVSRHADCLKVLRDAGCGRKPAGLRSARPFFVTALQAHRFTRRQRQTMLWSNPPDHSRLRGVVSRAFSAPRIEQLRSRILSLVDQCLDGLVGAGDVDVMDGIAFRLPVSVMGEIVGVPPADHDGLRRLFFDSVNGRTDEADTAIEAYFSELVAERRRTPRDDLLTALVTARDDDDQLSEDELLSTVALIFGAGFVTTTNLIGNGLLALLRHPAAAARLWEDPGLAPTAVEEMLRYDSPVQLNGRYVFEPIEVGGRVIAPGEFILTITGGANRDPGRFADPERFDTGRADNHPLSFGWGIHHCLGAQLARLEGQIVFRRLAERTASIELLDDDPPREPGFFLRGLSSLPVRLRPR